MRLRAAFAVCGIALAVALPAAAQSPGRMPRIGFLCLIPCGQSDVKNRLRDLGYVDGKTAAFETRSADGVADRLPVLAAELVAAKVDVIVAQHGVPAAEAAKRATTTIPIVFTGVGDPVAFGLVASLARPGGNLTGVAFLAPELTKKQFELLRELLPSLTRVTALRNPDNRADIELARERQSVSGVLRLAIQEIDVRTLADIEGAFEAATRNGSGAVYLGFDSLIFRNQKRIVELLAKHRLPAMAPAKSFVADGALVTYSPNFADLNRRAGTYVDRILKGARPDDLSIEQPTRFDFVINLRTAQALGLVIPPSLRQRADEVID